MEFKSISSAPAEGQSEGCLHGTECRASGETSLETVEQLFDGGCSTKWLDKGGASPEHPGWIELKLKEGNTKPATHYSLTCGNDKPEYDPVEWTLLGLLGMDAATGTEFWTAVDEQKSVSFSKRQQCSEFPVQRPATCARYKLVITNTRQEGQPVQLIGWNLFCRPASGQRYGSYSIPNEYGQPGQVVGGLCMGSYPCQSVFDSQANISWRHTMPVSDMQPAWIEYRLWARQRPITVQHYSMLPDPEILHLDPYNWTLQGWSADTSCWVNLHEADGEVFTDREQPSRFAVQLLVPCTRWRLVISSSTEFEGPVMLRGFALLVDAESAPLVLQGSGGSHSMQPTVSKDGGLLDRIRKRRLVVRDVVQGWRRGEGDKPPVLRGGFCFASGQKDDSGETADKAFDGEYDTHWVDPTARAENGSILSWIDYQLAPDQEPATLAGYSIISGKDSPEWDPRDWKLLGFPAVSSTSDPAERAMERFVNEDGWAAPTGTEASQWVLLDEQTDAEWAKRYQEKRFQIRQAVPCTLFRLQFTRLRQPDASCLQLAEIDLYVNPRSEPYYVPGKGPTDIPPSFFPAVTREGSPSRTSPSTSRVLPPELAQQAGQAPNAVQAGHAAVPSASSTMPEVAPTDVPQVDSPPATPASGGRSDGRASPMSGAGCISPVDSETSSNAGTPQECVSKKSSEKTEKKKRWGFLRSAESKELKDKQVKEQEKVEKKEVKQVQVKTAEEVMMEYGRPAQAKTAANPADTLAATHAALQERGEAICKLEASTKQMEDSAKGFADLAHEMLEEAQKESKSSWWPL